MRSFSWTRRGSKRDSGFYAPSSSSEGPPTDSCHPSICTATRIQHRQVWHHRSERGVIRVRAIFSCTCAYAQPDTMDFLTVWWSFLERMGEERVRRGRRTR